MIAAAVLPLALDDPDRAVALAGTLALLMGAMLVIGRLLHLGFVTALLSKPIRVGYLNGIALVVITSQLPRLLGVSVPGGSIWEELGQTVQAVAAGELDVAATVLGVGSLAVIVPRPRAALTRPGHRDRGGRCHRRHGGAGARRPGARGRRPAAGVAGTRARRRAVR